MTVQELALAAVNAVGSYLGNIALGVAHRAQDSAIERLYALITRQLEATELGSKILGDLEGNPTSPATRRAAGEVLADGMDANTSSELEAALRDVQVEQGKVVAGSTVSKGVRLTIGSKGKLNASRGNIVGGNLTQRTIRISPGLLVLILLVVAGVGATVPFVIGHDDPPAPPALRSPTGTCAPTPCGIGGDVEVYLTNVSDVKDATRYSQSDDRILKFAWRVLNNSAGELSFSESDVTVVDQANVELPIGIPFNSPELGCHVQNDAQVPSGGSAASAGTVCYSYTAESNQRPAAVIFSVGLFDSLRVELH
jgi:hypothetical protein